MLSCQLTRSQFGPVFGGTHSHTAPGWQTPAPEQWSSHTSAHTEQSTPSHWLCEAEKSGEQLKQSYSRRYFLTAEKQSKMATEGDEAVLAQPEEAPTGDGEVDAGSTEDKKPKKKKAKGNKMTLFNIPKMHFGIQWEFDGAKDADEEGGPPSSGPLAHSIG